MNRRTLCLLAALPLCPTLAWSQTPVEIRDPTTNQSISPATATGQAALTGAPTVSGITSVTSASASTLFSAGTKNHLLIANNNAATGSDLVCTWDGSTPTATHWAFRIYAAVSQWWDRPQFISNQAISCIGATGTVAVYAEAS